MTQNPTMKGEKIYELELDLAGVTDFGVSMDAIMSGKEAISMQGARFDLLVEGRGKGRLSGQVRGVDYLRMRADGRIDLDLHVTIDTDDGHRIALSGDGQAAPRSCERCSIFLQTFASQPPRRNTRGLMRGRSGA